MNINRRELIKKLEHMIVQREEEMLQRKADAYTRASDAETRYVAEHAEDWKVFANRIRSKLRRSQAITREDVPDGLTQGSYGSVAVFRPIVVDESSYIPRNQALINLLAVLQASPDELVSTSALDRMGAPLRELMKS